MSEQPTPVPPPTPTETADYTFVLRLDDRPGAMELIAATFAHRGISLTSTVGNDGALDPAGCAVVLLHFRATAARKEALKRTLTRLSRVLSLAEHAPEDAAMRRCALVRLTPNAPPPALGDAGTVEVVARDATTGETTYAIMGTTGVVAALLDGMRQGGYLRAVTHAVLAL